MTRHARRTAPPEAAGEDRHRRDWPDCSVDEIEFRSYLLDVVSDSVFVHDLGGDLIYVNKTALDTRGFTAEEIRALGPYGWVACEEDSVVAERVETLAREGSLIFRSWNVRKDGTTLPVEVHARMMPYGDRNVVIAVVRDLTERIATEEHIHHLAYYDPLTGLANRTLFTDRLEMALAHATRSGQPLAVMFLDIDYFKAINDTFGHALGDVLLESVARRLESLVRRGDTVARLGGDEFVLLLLDIDRCEASRVAQRALDSFRPPFAIGEHEVTITASIGIALSDTGHADADALMRQADSAMYRAKDCGRASYQLFDSSMSPTRDRLLLGPDLHDALRRDELHIRFQPQVEIATGRIVGAEALLRWEHPERGEIPPSVFVPLAEESGLITAIGEWALREACRQCREWLDAGLPALRIAVNLSPQQFFGRHLVQTIAKVLVDTDLPAEQLEIEITESTAMKDTGHVFGQLAALRSLGVAIALDDFGTGHSSLDRLKRFPIDTLKVDGSFVRDVGSDPSGRAIAETIIVLGSSLGLRVIAEGVETPSELRFLHDKGCELAQGFIYSKPLSAEEMASLLRGDAVLGWRRLLPASA